MSGLLQELFNTRRKIVLVLAVGAAVRLLAPLLNNKRRDPAVVVVDDAGRFAISLVGGHRAEANALAEEVAAALGGQAVITTAADALGLPTVERLGQEHGWRIENDGPAVTRAATALVNGERLGIVQDAGESDWWTGDPDRLERYASLDELAASDLPAALVITDRVLPPNYAEHLDRWVLYRPRSLVLGVGCSRGAPREAIAHLVNETLAEAALAPLSVRLVGTIDRRGDEPGLLALAHEHGWPLRTFASSELQGVDVPTPSAVVRRAVGTASVSEAAALLAAEGGPLLVTKRKNRLATVAIARWRAP